MCVCVCVCMVKKGGERARYLQTSVTIPAMMIWDLLVARMASRNSELSQALTSPLRCTSGASGYMSRISCGRGPLGPEGVSEEDV